MGIDRPSVMAKSGHTESPDEENWMVRVENSKNKKCIDGIRMFVWRNGAYEGKENMELQNKCIQGQKSQ